MAIALVGPGLGLRRALAGRASAATVLPLGLTVCASAQFLALTLDRDWAFWVGIAALNALNVTALRRASPAGAVPASRGPGDLAELRGAAAPWLLSLAVLAPTQFAWNRAGADGSFRLDPLAPYDDAVFHVGLARELTLGLPPQVPGLSGVPLGYHLGQGLVRAAALRHAGVEPFDQISRFEPALLALGLILALRALAQALRLPPLAVTVAGFSLVFTDFSFLFAGETSAFYWTDLLKGNLLLSLAYVNPVAPGLLLLLGLLCALAHHESQDARGALALAALLAAALPHFKVFLGAHLLLGLAVAGVFAGRAVRRDLGLVAVPCAAMTAVLALGRGGAAVTVSLAPFDLARVTRESLALPELHGLSFAAWCAFWLFASLGLRWLGVGPAWRAVVDGPRAGAVAAVVALSAWPIGLAFRIAVTDALPGQKVVNDAAYVLEQGAPLLWLFAAAGIARLAREHAGWAVAGLALLALPATVQFVVRKASAPPDHLPAPMVRAASALRALAHPGEVVLQRPGARYPPAPVLLASLRVPYERYTPFRTQFASKEFLERRHRQVFEFFRTESASEARAIARELGATWLALYGPDRVRFPTEGFLEAVYEEEGARVYRLRLDPP